MLLKQGLRKYVNIEILLRIYVNTPRYIKVVDGYYYNVLVVDECLLNTTLKFIIIIVLIDAAFT